MIIYIKILKSSIYGTLKSTQKVTLAMLHLMLHCIYFYKTEKILKYFGDSIFSRIDKIIFKINQ